MAVKVSEETSNTKNTYKIYTKPPNKMHLTINYGDTANCSVDKQNKTI